MKISLRFAMLRKVPRGKFIWMFCGAFSLASCGKKPAGPPVYVEAPGIVVTNPGAEPRKPLRYRVAKGARATTELVTEMSLKADELGGPPLTMVAEIETSIDDMALDGRATLRTKVDRATLRDPPDTIPADTRHQVDELAGVAITALLAPDGKLDEPKLDLAGKAVPPGVEDQMRAILQSYEEIAMVLPHAPIGLHATWRSTRPLANSGMKMTATTTISLDALDGDRASYSISTAITGPDQTVGTGDTVIGVSGIHGKATGKCTVDLATLAMSGELTTDVESTMTGGGSASKMVMNVKRTFKQQP